MAVEVENSAYLYYLNSEFSHNPLHDLESLWWVGVWFLLCHYTIGSFLDAAVQKHIEAFKKVSHTLFTDGANYHSPLIRSTILIDSAPRRFPTTVQHFVALLDEFRAQLVTYYEITRQRISICSS